MPSAPLALAAPTTPDPMEAPPVRWGILAPGGIANSFADAVHHGTRSRVVAAGSRSLARAAEFAERHGVATAHGSYAELVADPDVEAVYVSSPHSEHHEHALLALRAGKPVLVEKSFTRSLRETDEVLRAAEDGGLLAAEAMWSRYLPTYDVLRRTVEAGTLGEVLVVEADHGQLLWPDGPARLSQPELAGGALLDLGVYPVAFADHLLGGLTDVSASGVLTELGVDATSTVDARGPGGELARLWCTMAGATSCPARVVGTRARLEVSGRFYDVGSSGQPRRAGRGRARPSTSRRSATVATATRPRSSPVRWRRGGTRRGRCRGPPPVGSWPSWTRCAARSGSSTREKAPTREPGSLRWSSSSW